MTYFIGEICRNTEIFKVFDILMSIIWLKCKQIECLSISSKYSRLFDLFGVIHVYFCLFVCFVFVLFF